MKIHRVKQLPALVNLSPGDEYFVKPDGATEWTLYKVANTGVPIKTVGIDQATLNNIANKVDKETGKGLVLNTEIAKLNNLNSQTVTDAALASKVNLSDELIKVDTVQDLRNLSSTTLNLLSSGLIKGVLLLGYYTKGDISPTEYYISNTTDEDDGGSVFNIAGVKLEHSFVDSINILNYGAVKNSITQDIGDILVKVTSKYSNVKLVFPKGEYFIDMDLSRVIGTGFTNRLIIQGEGKDLSKINLNTYTGNRQTSWNVNLSFLDIHLDGMTQGRTVNTVLSSYISINNGYVSNCRFTNFNSSLFVGKTGLTVFDNNEFGIFTDHAIYYRNDVLNDTRQDTELIITNNTFLASNRFQDFDNPNPSNPRHAIKVTGAIPSVTISKNVFKGYGGNIVFTTGDGEGTIKKIAKDVLIENNIFYTAYSSIEYAVGMLPTTFNYSNEHVIRGNKFYDSSELNFGTGGFGSIGHVYIRESGYTKLIIDSNNFFGTKDSIIATALTTGLHEATIINNTFNNSRISYRSLNNLLFKNNTASGGTSYLFNNTLPVNGIFINNTFINYSTIFRTNLGASTTNFIMFKSNDFIGCNSVLQTTNYGLVFNWSENNFINCTQIFERAGSNTQLTNFTFENNKTFNTVNLSLDTEFNNIVTIAANDLKNIGGIKQTTTKPVASTGRKTGSIIMNQSSTRNTLEYWNGSIWQPIADANVLRVATSGRPTNILNGETIAIVDLTLNKPIWGTNTAGTITWRDATGATV